MHVALAQLRVDAGAVDGNVERALAAVDEAAARGADLVALPELFTVGFFAFDEYADSAEPIGGPTHERLRAAAREHGVALLAGSVVEDLAATRERTDLDVPASEGLANTAVLFDAEGRRRAVYRKRHLFGHDSRERELLVPGERTAVAELGGFTIGVTTCYDLRFPEQYRELLDAGTTLVLVPSAWPYPRVEHWRTLGRARAIENLQYVAAVNGTGDFEAASLLGRSAIYDPWGTTVASAGEEADTVHATLDPDRVATVRAEFPALDDRRA